MRQPDDRPEQETVNGLATLLREERPRPRPEFASRLDARAAAGFPRGSEKGAGSSRLERLRGAVPPPRRTLPALAAATALVAVIGVALVATSEDGPAPPGLGDEPVSLGRDRGAAGATPEASRPDDAIVPSPVPPSGGDGIAPRASQRRVERSATLVLAPPPDEVEDVADGVIGITDRYRGFVLSSSVSSGDEAGNEASFDLRIPVTSLRAALRDLSKLAHLASRSENALDVTQPFVDAQERVSDLRAERRALERRLAEPNTPAQIADLRVRLRSLRSQLGQARGQLRGIRQRTDYASVSVTVKGEESSSTGTGGWSPGDALKDAASILSFALAALLVGLAALVPLGLVALGIWGARRLSQRRREATLDAT